VIRSDGSIDSFVNAWHQSPSQQQNYRDNDYGCDGDPPPNRAKKPSKTRLRRLVANSRQYFLASVIAIYRFQASRLLERLILYPICLKQAGARRANLKMPLHFESVASIKLIVQIQLNQVFDFTTVHSLFTPAL
jgi:hypothetical protein